MIKDFLDAIRSYFEAFQMITKLKLWGFAFVPALISLLLGAGIFITAYQLSDNIGHLIVSWYPLESGKFVVEKIATIAGGILVAILGILLYKNLVIVLAGPFMSPLSEKVENALTGQVRRVGFSLPQMLGDFFRGLRIALRNIVRELFFTVLLLLMGLIPIIAPFTTVLIFMVQSFYAGFGNFDFFLERHYKVGESVRFMRRHKWAAIGNGSIFLLLIFTGIGVVIAPVLSTIAATIEGVKRLDKIPKAQLEPHELV